MDARGICRHGFALNVNPDMRYWEGIAASGLENLNKTSLTDFLDPAPTVGEVAEAAAGIFAQVFMFH